MQWVDPTGKSMCSMVQAAELHTDHTYILKGNVDNCTQQRHRAKH